VEEKVGSVEGDVKEAIELSQNAAKAGSVAVSPGSSWWNSGSASSVTIKTSDGRDVTSFIEHLVEKAFSYYRMDDLGLIDYALNSIGAAVIPSLTSPSYQIPTKFFFGLLSGAVEYVKSPVTALHHEIRAGYCWPMAGSIGQLGVKLAAPVRISQVTIDHVAKPNALDLRTAPRQMELWGLVEGQDNIQNFQEYQARQEQERQEALANGESAIEEPSYPSSLPSRPTYMRIASFTYDVHAPNNIQTFPIPQDIQDLGIDVGLVVLMINSNWGHDEYTCLYRFRVHGTRLQEPPMPELL